MGRGRETPDQDMVREDLLLEMEVKQIHILVESGRRREDRDSHAAGCGLEGGPWWAGEETGGRDGSAGKQLWYKEQEVRLSAKRRGPRGRCG